MTTLCKEKARCSICGSESEYTEINSTNAFGSADLDSRPPERKRSTIFAWVQRCPECGYCASDVSRSRPGSEAVVNGTGYKNQLNDPAYPELANSFLCRAIIDRDDGDYAAATLALTFAAWVCDDFDSHAQAVACRQKAADMLVLAEEHGQRVSNEDGTGTALLVDLLRRSGQIEQARKVIAKGRASIPDDFTTRILDYQSALLDKNDVSCHTVAEALGEKEDFQSTGKKMEPDWRLAATDLDRTQYYLDEASVTFDPDTVTFIVKVVPPPGSETYRATMNLFESYGKRLEARAFTLQRWLIDEARNVVRLLHLSAYDVDGKFIASLSLSSLQTLP